MILFSPAYYGLCRMPEHAQDWVCQPITLGSLLAMGGGLVFFAVMWAVFR